MDLRVGLMETVWLAGSQVNVCVSEREAFPPLKRLWESCPRQIFVARTPFGPQNWPPFANRVLCWGGDTPFTKAHD